MIRNHALRQNIANLIQVNRDMEGESYSSLVQVTSESKVVQDPSQEDRRTEESAVIIQSTVRRQLAFMRFYDLGDRSSDDD